ncbi:MAG: hypothetical protein KBB09_01520 [Firmicutes bacterium]|nr:hypothetical protein [Bacillota bacterium]
MFRGRILASLLLVSSLVLLTGCIGTYSFDFVSEGDFENEEGAWYVDSTGEVFYMEGLWAKDTYLTAPYGYKGDFTCTYEFFVNTAAGSEIDWIYFVLLDNKFQDGVPVNKFFGFTIHNLGATGEEYSVWQGTTPWDYFNEDVVPPGLRNNDVNKLTIKKTGDEFSVSMNDEPLHTMTILPGNMTEYWYPAINVTYDHSIPYGVYFRKLTVRYTKGNEMAAPWAFP